MAGKRQARGARLVITQAARPAAVIITAAVALSACGTPAPSTKAAPSLRPSRVAASSSATATPSATAAPSATPSATASTPAGPDIAGTWTGTYTCSQGLTGLTLKISVVSGTTLSALFDFHAVPSNPGVPTGSYTMTGSYTPATVSLTQGHWIQEPSGYSMVDLSGATPSGDTWAGRVGDLTGCTTFSLTK